MQNDDEIDLAELFASLWAKRFFIAFGTLIVAGIAIFYAQFVASPSYEAKSRFEIFETSTQDFADLGGLASLAGLDIGGNAGSERAKIEDRIKSRDFFDQIAELADLYEDPVFNPLLRTPGLITQILRNFGFSNDSPPDQARMAASISLNFFNSVSIVEKKNGILELTVSHPIPERAAHIANIVVEHALENYSQMSRAQMRDRIDYFSQELLEARIELDQSSQQLAEFSLRSNLRSQEELLRSAAQLVALRERLDDLTGRLSSLDALAQLSIGMTRFDVTSRRQFLSENPNATDLDFRRLLGWSGSEDTWQLPSQDNLTEIRSRLVYQISTLQRTITELELSAGENAETAAELEGLRRELAVDEALYEGMLKKFESESLIFGFAVDGGKIIETAIPPISPSAPKKSLIAALGLVLGMFLSSAIVLIMQVRSGILHTTRSIADAYPIAQVKLLRHASRNAGTKKRHNKLVLAVDDLLTRVLPSPCKSIAVIPGTLDTSNYVVSEAIADFLCPENGRVCIVVLTDALNFWRDTSVEITSQPSQVSDNIFVVKPQLGRGSRRAVAFSNELEKLSKEFDCLILFCSPPHEGVGMASTAVGCVDALVVLSQRGRSQREDAVTVASVMAEHKSTPTGLFIT